VARPNARVERLEGEFAVNLAVVDYPLARDRACEQLRVSRGERRRARPELDASLVGKRLGRDRLRMWLAHDRKNIVDRLALGAKRSRVQVGIHSGSPAP
jgi:hypothetical protein